MAFDLLASKRSFDSVIRVYHGYMDQDWVMLCHGFSL